MSAPDGAWRAAYECGVCGHGWTTLWSAEAWPLKRVEAA